MDSLPRSSHGATISGMSVTYELLDVAYPFVSAVYACRCGKQEVRYASEAGAPPADWVVHGSGEAAGFVCPDCARSLPPDPAAGPPAV
jgi:hypothetical protein